MSRLHISMCFSAKIGIIVSFLLLAGCHFFGPKYTIIKPPASLPYKVRGSSDKKIMAMQHAFNEHGVRVITQGQDYLVSIPSSTIFAYQSPRLTWQSYELLNQVVCYLRLFNKVSVSVQGYVNKCANPKREHALSLARAQAVADYLWSQGIDSRFIFTQGLGSDKPIVPSGGGDNSLNSRIEITFRDQVA